MDNTQSISAGLWNVYSHSEQAQGSQSPASPSLQRRHPAPPSTAPQPGPVSGISGLAPLPGLALSLASLA